MLRLTLVQGETVNIGKDIKLRLAADSAYWASIVIDAPKEVDITREQTDPDISGEPVEAYKTSRSKISIVDNRRKK